MNGIGTAIAAGDRRSIIISAIPVVGGDGVGYQPMISVPNVGVTAQVRPTFVPGTKTAMLDIASIITRWGPSRPPAIIGSAWPADKQVTATNPLPTPPPAQNAAKPAPATPPPPVAPSVRTHSTQGGSASCPIDLPVMPTQQIGTTLRVPLGKPVIVGSITFAPAGAAGPGRGQGGPGRGLPHRHDEHRAGSDKVAPFGVRQLAAAFQNANGAVAVTELAVWESGGKPPHSKSPYRVTKCSTPCVLAITVRPLSVTRNPRLRSNS